MLNVELALEFAENGFVVFPVKHDTKDNTKKPYIENGHLRATADPGVITEWWEKYPNARVGVPAGVNNIVVADIDVKAAGKQGWDSLDKANLTLPETFEYTTGTGGKHFVYAAPKDVILNGQSDYRKLSGVDRRGGSSWVMWASDQVPMPWDLSEAPEWLIDPAREVDFKAFKGELKDWYELLVEGEPNVIVRRAIANIGEDMSHSEMVEAEHHAIRLGAEGNAGVPLLIDKLYEAWMNRPSENHTTPEGEWDHKFFEALESGLEKFGGLTDQLKNLPEYNFGLVPSSVPDSLVVGPDAGKPGFSRLLGELVKATKNDDLIASILWSAPTTTATAREWGLQFVFRRITEARLKPEPTRENPRIEEQREREKVTSVPDKPVEETKKNPFALISDEERDYLSIRPTYVDHVIETAEDMGYDQLPYFRSTAWVTAAMAFSFRGFIPKSRTHKMGCNIWNINLGGSGTGKSVTGMFRDGILKILFLHDPTDIPPYDLGDDSSPQGLHMALLERDRKASMFSSDEAAGFFTSLGLKDWKTSIEEKLTSWYGGFVQGSNKLSQKELRGKSALTALSMHMFGTPEKVTKVINADMFETGFMARVNWVFGNPPRDDDSRFDLDIEVVSDDDEIEFDQTAPELVAHGVDLILATSLWNKSVAMSAAPGVMARLSQAYKDMYRISEHRENWHMVEPSLTRLSETLIKMTAISAMYRSDKVMRMDDALHAIKAMEEYFENLHRVVALISAGDFQRAVNEIEEWVRSRGGRQTRTKIFYRFKNLVVRDGRELESYLSYLVESGIFNRDEENGAVVYSLNGS